MRETSPLPALETESHKRVLTAAELPKLGGGEVGKLEE